MTKPNRATPGGRNRRILANGRSSGESTTRWPRCNARRMARIALSRCLSAADIGFLGVLFPPVDWAPLTVGLPAAPRRHYRTLTGFPRSARMRCGRAGCPLYPGSDGVPCGHRDVRGRRLPPCNGWLLPPRHCTPTRDVKLTRHQQGFRVIHPSGLPLTCGTRSERAPSGFSLSFAPGRYQPRTSGRGRVWNTNPRSRLRHHAEPPIDEPAHNVRPRVAASASAASGAAVWSGSGARMPGRDAAAVRCCLFRRHPAAGGRRAAPG